MLRAELFHRPHQETRNSLPTTTTEIGGGRQAGRSPGVYVRYLKGRVLEVEERASFEARQVRVQEALEVV